MGGMTGSDNKGDAEVRSGLGCDEEAFFGKYG